MATVRVDVSPHLLLWARDVGFDEEDELAAFPKFDSWVRQQSKPTLNELTRFAQVAGVPFGYFFLDEPPAWTLPVPDFREGYNGDFGAPSTDLMAVLNQSLSRQDWYREYAQRHDLPELTFVGSAAGWAATRAAAEMRQALHFEPDQRQGSWNDTRKYLIRAFEELGGLSVATSMVGNNNRRLLDPSEFRGFALPDRWAPLVFVNTNQTLNGQIFTLVHEFAHIWRGAAGIGNEEPRADGQTAVERWCNDVASQVLVPEEGFHQRWSAVSRLPLAEALDSLGRTYRCGNLVVLQALRRYRVAEFANFDAVYSEEERRLKVLAERSGTGSGGDHYNNQPYRVGDRLSRAIIGDTLEGRTTYAEGMKLMSMRSAMTFDEYARRLGVRAR